MGFGPPNFVQLPKTVKGYEYYYSARRSQKTLLLLFNARSKCAKKTAASFLLDFCLDFSLDSLRDSLAQQRGDSSFGTAVTAREPNAMTPKVPYSVTTYVKQKLIPFGCLSLQHIQPTLTCVMSGSKIRTPYIQMMICTYLLILLYFKL